MILTGNDNNQLYYGHPKSLPTQTQHFDDVNISIKSVGSQVLSIRMNDMQLEKETDLTCSDEDGNIEYYKVKMLIPPKVTASLNSKATLAEGEELKASCSAKGGQPNVSIRNGYIFYIQVHTVRTPYIFPTW